MNVQLLCCDAWLVCISTLYLTPNKGCFSFSFFPQRYLADVVENFSRLYAFACMTGILYCNFFLKFMLRNDKSNINVATQSQNDVTTSLEWWPAPSKDWTTFPVLVLTCAFIIIIARIISLIFCLPGRGHRSSSSVSADHLGRGLLPQTHGRPQGPQAWERPPGCQQECQDSRLW